jgi:hypothetical protein
MNQPGDYLLSLKAGDIQVRIRRKYLWLSIAAVYILVVSATAYLLFSEWAYDDPFITYRYAYNLAHGQGFVYNPGERVLSTTTPLFTILLAALNFSTSDLPRSANLVGAISIALGGILLWDLSRTWKTPVAGWAGLFLYPTFTLPLTTLGSETPLYIALNLGAIAFYARRRYPTAAAFAALATLTRPDGILVAIVLAAHYLLRIRRPVPWKAILVFAALVIPWFIFAWLYFGYPLPVTLAAKQQQGTLAISQTFAPGFLWIINWYSGSWQYWLEAVLAIIGVYWLVRKAHQWALLLSWTGLYFISYSLLGVSRYFWYYAPLVPGYIALVGLGLEAVGNLIQNSRLGSSSQPVAEKQSDVNLEQPALLPRPSPLRKRISYVAVGIILISLTLAQATNVYQRSIMPDPRATVYRAVGEWLRDNTPSDSLISSLEIGIIGYYAGRRVVDFAGLLQPEVAEQLHNSPNYDVAAIWAVTNYSPDYIVLVKGTLPALKQGYLNEHCQIGEHFQNSDEGYAAFINVYTCQ